VSAFYDSGKNVNSITFGPNLKSVEYGSGGISDSSFNGYGISSGVLSLSIDMNSKFYEIYEANGLTP
jgi:hypothetical protein